MKRILLIAVLACVNSITFSQNSNFTFGIELKPTISWLSGNSMVGTDKSLVGYGVGVSSSYNFNKHLALKSGLLFERKGMKTVVDLTDNSGNSLGSSKIYENQDYLVLPILLSYYTKGDVKFYFDMGAYLGYLLKAQYVVAKTEMYPEQNSDYTEYSKPFDFGVSFGSGVSIPLNNRLLCDIGVKGDFGLIDTNNPAKTDVIDGGKIIPNSIGLNVGLKYKI